MIQAATPGECFVLLQQQIDNYWARLAQAGDGRGVTAVTPAKRLSK